MGHSSVITTERHYAPLLVSEIDDFVLYNDGECNAPPPTKNPTNMGALL